jgi:four helix bundle protein
MEELTFGFEQLELWKKAKEFKMAVCTDARKFPVEEKYRLIDQLIRSSRSINALLSEGHGRFTYADQLHYCVQARGSLSETINHLIDANDEQYITSDRLNYFKIKGKEIEKLINGYINYLRKQKGMTK